jgi:hypothetical protein
LSLAIVDEKVPFVPSLCITSDNGDFFELLVVGEAAASATKQAPTPRVNFILSIENKKPEVAKET